MQASPGHNASVQDRMVVEDVVEDGSLLTVEEEALLLRKCRLNKVELVNKILDGGRIGPNFTFSNGDSILMIACKCGYKKLAVSVIERGASNLDQQDHDGNTAAHWAYAMGFNELGEYLVFKGANDRLKNSQGYTCRNWERPGMAVTAVTGADEATSSPSLWKTTASTGHHMSEDGVHLPSLSPQKEARSLQPQTKSVKSQMLAADPRPGAARQARKKVRKSEMGATSYQRMYLGLDEPERSQSTPPIGGRDNDQDGRRPSSSRGRLDSGPLDGTASPSASNPSKVKPGHQQKLKGPTVTANHEEHVDAPGMTSIFGFLKNGGTINEPLTVEAMRRLGLVEEQLRPTDVNGLKAQYQDDRIVQVRLKLLEERRQELVKRCITERQRLKNRSKDASLEEIFIEYAGDMQMNISEFMDMLKSLGLLSDGRDQPGMLGKTHAANIFKAFAIRIGKTYEITWEQFVKMERQISSDLGIKSIRNPDEKVKSKPITTPGRGPAAAVDKHAFSTEDRIEEIRKKEQKNQEFEMKRLEKNFGRVLEVRAQSQAYKEQVKRLESERLGRLEAKALDLANSRIEHEFEHVERVLKQQKEAEKRRTEELARIQRKQKEADAAKKRIEEKRQEHNMILKATLQTKQHLRDEQRHQNERKEEYERKILRDKIARESERLDKDKNEKAELLAMRRKLWAQKKLESDLFERAAVNFRKTGVLKKPPGIRTLGSFDELIEKEVVEDFNDLNPHAEHVQKNTTTKRLVESGEYAYFKICVDQASQILFTIKSHEGRAEMYIGNHETPFPTKEKHNFSKVGHDKVTVFHLDRAFNLGYYYIGVYGQGLGHSVFSFSPSWSVSEVGEKEKFQDDSMGEAQVMQRVRERINKVLQARLEGKGKDFARKYQELFAEKQTSNQAKKD